MEQVKWFDRNFNFSITQNIFPAVIERLRGTPARLEERCRLLPDDILTRRIDNTWSIKENLGHLTDLEPLWQGRLEDIRNGEIMLRATDLQNRRTHDANHNDVPLETLLASFRQVRQQTIVTLEALDEAIIFQSGLHPRLKTPMRTLDIFLFTADHDDHHLARMTEIARIVYSF
jgi:uncharacterized damage-inducible protein DinB